MTNPSLWNQLLIWPIVNLLVAFYKFFEFLHIPGPLGFAIILLTIAIRLLLYPLMQKQMASAKKMASLKPHMDALNLKHKDDKKALQQAQMELYKQHGVNPAAGCLPLLIQMPVLIALYNVFYQVLNNGNLVKMVATINQVVYVPALKLGSIDPTFFGINLGVKPSEYAKYGVWLLAIPVITGALQWWQTRLMQPAVANTTNTTNITNSKTNEEKKPEDTAAEMQKQMGIIMPLMFGYFALQFPVGLALYWNVFGLLGILQQLRVNAEHAEPTRN
ncbi:membrane protein insertase YidC [Candidatus Gottesmanbacteria bacterium]|nr:membrane protein insertase YidC [Candidatus Gottesmanbacteria bacterium]